MRAPVARATEIISEIVNELEPLQPGISPIGVKKAVQQSMDRLQETMPLLHRPAAHENKNSAKAIRKTLHRLRHQIAAAPPWVQSCLAQISPHYPDGFECPGRGTRPTEEVLAWMDWTLEGYATWRLDRDQTKYDCATVAHHLLQHYSSELPASSSATSPLRVIAGLVYEYVTGEPDRDLERACEEALAFEREYAAYVAAGSPAPVGQSPLKKV